MNDQKVPGSWSAFGPVTEGTALPIICIIICSFQYSVLLKSSIFLVGLFQALATRLNRDLVDGAVMVDFSTVQSRLRHLNEVSVVKYI